MRLLGAQEIMKTDFSEELLRKIEIKRKSLEKVLDFEVSMKKGLTWGFEERHSKSLPSRKEAELAERPNK